MTGFFDRRKLDLLLALFSRLQYGRLDVLVPDGTSHRFDGPEAGPHAEMSINHMGAISRIMADGKMGFCEAVMEGAQRAMRVAYSREEEKLERHLAFLASVGSVSPYIGLFGTVIGIMNSFIG